MYLIIFCVIIIFIIQFSDSNIESNKIIRDIYDDLVIIHPRAKSLRLSEGDKSVTINKKNIKLCVTNKNGMTYNYNILLYVAIHELSHVLCDEQHHTQKFEKINSLLLQRAIDLELYNPNIKIPSNYCAS